MAAINILKELAEQHHRKKFPTVPDHAKPGFKYTDRSSNGLTKCILDYINFSGGFATRINSQGQYREKLNKWTKSTTAKGTADIHALINGKHLSIEIKIGKDKQSKYQKQMQEKITAAGGSYFIARDFEGFYNWIKSI